jgi:hypothetical protein
MGIRESHALFKEALQCREGFFQAKELLNEAASTLFPCLEEAYAILGKAKNAGLGTPQRSTYLRQFGEAVVGCTQHSEGIKQASADMVAALEKTIQKLDEGRQALNAEPLN